MRDVSSRRTDTQLLGVRSHSGRSSESPTRSETTVIHSLPLIVTAGALLLPWYLGTMEALIEEGIIDPAVTPGAGLSGGAITAMLACAGQRPKDVYAALKQHLVECYESWDPKSGGFPCDGQLSGIEFDLFSSLLNESDPTAAARACPHVNVAFTNIDPSDPTFSSISSFLVSNYTSDRQILSDLISSSFLACSSMSKPYFVNEGRATVDGGYSTTLDDLCGGNDKDCLKIQVYYPNTTEDGPVCVRQNTTDPSVTMDLLDQCLKAAGGSFNVSVPQTPAPAWANFTEIGNLPTTCPGGPPQFQPPGDADLYPGKFIPLNYSCFEWQCMAYIPYPDRLDDLFSLGKKEAQAWVQAAGPPPPSPSSVGLFGSQYGMMSWVFLASGLIALL